MCCEYWDMPGEALLGLAEVAPWLVIAVFLGAFAMFGLSMAAQGRREGPRIVIIDDDAHVRKALRRVIENKTDFQIVGEAADGAQGVAVVEAVIPDLVVIDVLLPVMDGIQATRRIREAHPWIKVVGFSSPDDDATGAIMAYAGADLSIVKGDSPDEIVTTLLDLSHS
jgi:DNA-binding NarL/FixJ family response regulator